MSKLFSILLLVMMVVLSSCDRKPSSYTFQQMSSEDVRSFIEVTNQIKTPVLGQLKDQQYAIPDIRWIQEKFDPAYKDFLFRYNLTRPEPEVNDCDKYVVHALSTAHRVFKNDSNRPKDTALAVGEFDFYFQIEGHAINLFLAIKDNKLVLVYYEPMLQQFVDLDPSNLDVISWRM